MFSSLSLKKPTLFRRLADIYTTQARQVLEAGNGNQPVSTSPVSLIPNWPIARAPKKRWGVAIAPSRTLFPKEPPRTSGIAHLPTQYRMLQLHIADLDDTTPVAAEQLLVGLRTIHQPLAFEIMGNGTQTIIQMACPLEDLSTVEGLLSVRYPRSQMVRSDQDALQTALDKQQFAFSEYTLAHSFAYLIATPTSFKNIDPLATILGALETLPEGAWGALQILFCPVDDIWRSTLRQAAVDRLDASISSHPEREDLISWVDKKVSAPFFAVRLRLIGTDPSVIHRLEGFLELFNHTVNRFVALPSDTTLSVKNKHQAILERITYQPGVLLNATELASLVHMPSASICAEKLQRNGIRTVSLPSYFRARHSGLYLGLNHHRGKQWAVHLTEEELTRHLYCCGISGTGKSTFLLNALLQLIDTGYGIAVLDPHGDLVEQQLLPRIPAHRRKDVIWFDPGDDAYPIAFNILAAESEDERELLAEDLVSIFQRMTTGWGPRLETLLAYATLAIVGSKQSGTLNDLRQFLADEAVRATFLADHPDESVRYFWEVEFPTYPKGAVGPVQTRLNTFLRRRRIRNIVGQQHNRLPFRRIMDEGKILLCKLSHGAIGETNSHLLGSLLCSRIQQTAMMRQDIPEAQRRTFILAIDEFHHFICRSMETILSGARKYHLGLCLAHQEMQQLWGRDKDVAASVLANPYTRLCFRVGDHDAKQLVEGFAGFSVKDLQNLSRGQALLRLDRSDYSCNLHTEAPPPMPTNGNQIAREIIEHSQKTYGTPATALTGEPPDALPSSNPSTLNEDDFYA